MVDYVLKASLERHQVITIVYQSADKITQRKIIVRDFKDDKVEAYCYLRHQVRLFKKSSILAAELNTH